MVVGAVIHTAGGPRSRRSPSREHESSDSPGPWRALATPGGNKRGTRSDNSCFGCPNAVAGARRIGGRVTTTVDTQAGPKQVADRLSTGGPAIPHLTP